MSYVPTPEPPWPPDIPIPPDPVIPPDPNLEPPIDLDNPALPRWWGTVGDDARDYA